MSSDRPHADSDFRKAFLADSDDLLDADLMSRPVPELRSVAGRLGWSVRGQRRADIVEQLRQHYNGRDSAVQALARLGEAERRLLALATWVPSSGLRSMAAAIAALTTLLPADWIGDRSGAPPDATEIEHRLLNLAESGYLMGPISGRFVPDLTVTRAFGDLLLPVPPLTPGAAPAAGGTIHRGRDPLSCLIHACHALIDLDADGVPLLFETRDERPPWSPGRPAQVPDRAGGIRIPPSPPLVAPPVEAAVARAVGDGRDAASFWVGILVAFRDANDSVGLEPAGSFENLVAWLSWSHPYEVLATLVTLWTRLPSDLWDELSWLQHEGADWRVHKRPYGWSMPPFSAAAERTTSRTFVLELLWRWPRTAETAPDGWIDMAVFSEAVRIADPEGILPSAGHAWNLVDAATLSPLALDEAADWMRGPGRLLHYAMHGPLRWLGLVDTVLDARGRLVAARLTPIGSALLDGAGLPLEAAAPVTWTDEGSATVEAALASMPAICAFEACAAGQGLRDGRLAYRFGPDTVARAFESDRLPHDILLDLERVAPPPPPGLPKAIDRWWSRWGHVRRYSGVALVEVGDETLVRELLATTGIERHVIVRCSPTSFVVDAGQVDAILESLRGAGHTPRVVRSEP